MGRSLVQPGTLTPEARTTAFWKTPSLGRYLIAYALFLLAGWLIFNVSETVTRILHFYTPLPYWDYWRVAQDLSAFETLNLRAFWGQHNDHRIIFPEIVFALDMLWVHGRLILPLIVSFVCYVATWLLFSSTLFRDRNVSRLVVFTATLLAGVIALWKGSAAVLAAPFQLQWTLMQLASACALFWLCRLKDTSQIRFLAGLIAAGVVANYSSGNGLLLWPLLLALGWLLHIQLRDWIALAIASVCFTGLYFVRYQFGNELQLSNLVLHPLYLVGYFGSYLSMPFGGMKGPGFGVLVGLANLAITILLLAVTWRRNLLSSTPSIVLFGSYAFTLLTILITAAGRMDPADPSFGGAKPARYITVPLMNWAVFILLTFWVLARARLRFFTPPVLVSLMSLLLLWYLPKLRDWLTLNAEDNAEQQLGALSLENDIVDPNLIRKVFISVEFVVNFLPELREQKLSIFFKSRDRWLGKPVSQFAPMINTVFPGKLSHALPVRGGVELQGWADGTELRRAYTWVVLANEHGQIVGFGQHLPAGFPATLHRDDIPPSLAWVGFVNLAYPSQVISAYVVDSKRGGLYPIAGSFAVPAVQPASLEESSAALPGITWGGDSTWTPNRLPARVPFGPAPSGVIYASWSNDDRLTGTINSSVFNPPANSCVVLPVLHGPKVGGLSVDLLDADTGQIIGSSPMQDWVTLWQYWRVPVPPRVTHLRVVARDGGTEWGEWVATANPLGCR